MRTVEISDIELILRSTFPSANFTAPLINLKLGDFEEWDSVGNFNLLLAFEDFYLIRFSMEEISELKSIAAIVDALSSKMR